MTMMQNNGRKLIFQGPREKKRILLSMAAKKFTDCKIEQLIKKYFFAILC